MCMSIFLVCLGQTTQNPATGGGGGGGGGGLPICLAGLPHDGGPRRQVALAANLLQEPMCNPGAILAACQPSTIPGVTADRHTLCCFTLGKQNVLFGNPTIAKCCEKTVVFH